MLRFERRRPLAALLVTLSMLAGCADGNSGEEAGPVPSSTTMPSSSSMTTPSDPTSTAPSPSTTVAGGGCAGDDAIPPDGATDVAQVDVDVDGDGSEDRVSAYRRADGERRIGVELAAGGTSAVDASTSQVEGPAPLSVLGGVDLGGDGETVVALTDAGASVVIVGLFQFVECALARVSFESGQAVELPVGGAITHGDGLRCATGGDGPPLVRLSATSTDGERFTATETGYRVDGNTLVEVDSQTTTLTRGADDEAINAYYTLDCPPLERGLGNL
ncbi:MAG TPA: hypothetical protein VGR26_05545 [Acidimicrobiales bacterium]|nr:hypothetical protein [Acidimicrobiales bacterium]